MGLAFVGSKIFVTERPVSSEQLGYEKLDSEGNSGEIISQAVRFDSVKIDGQDIALEFHRIEQTNETFAVLKKTTSKS